MTTEPRKRALPTTTVAINGATLREMRIRAGISLADFARQVGISRPYLNKLELGHSKRVSPEVYIALLRELSVQNYGALLADPVSRVVA